jgi:hypothetical protein
MTVVYPIQSPLLTILIISFLSTGLSFVTDIGIVERNGNVLPTISESIIRNRKDATLLSMSSSPSNTGASDWASRLLEESKEIAACANLVLSAILLPPDKVETEDIIRICDEIDAISTASSDSLRTKALEARRYEYLAKLMQKDYDAYVATASFLSPSRIPRLQLPNLQDVTIDKNAVPKNYEVAEDGSVPLVDDCELEDLKYKMNPLDVVLLAIFRSLVEKNTNGVTSDKKGILGLVEQARTFMLQPGQTAEAQHKMVSDTLAGLMTPVLPPFYRIFMSGIGPNIGTKWDGKQIGPWFYAPWLTTIVTPIFFGFLVGPSYPNRRKDGHLGGLVVEKCKFLQESGCKGICLHDCKLPTQEFFQEELGLSLTVSPNFVTQECQWSFGETPLPPSEDKSFPQGCLNGCDSRKALVAMGSAADACN